MIIRTQLTLEQYSAVDSTVKTLQTSVFDVSSLRHTRQRVAVDEILYAQYRSIMDAEKWTNKVDKSGEFASEHKIHFGDDGRTKVLRIRVADEGAELTVERKSRRTSSKSTYILEERELPSMAFETPQVISTQKFDAANDLAAKVEVRDMEEFVSQYNGKTQWYPMPDGASSYKVNNNKDRMLVLRESVEDVEQVEEVEEVAVAAG